MIRSQPANAPRRGSQGSGLPPRSAEKGFVRVVELGRPPGEGMLMRPSGPCSLIGSPSPAASDDPSRPSSLLLPVKTRRAQPQRQKSARLRPILRAFRKPPNLPSRILRPHRHRLAHGKHPPFAILITLLPIRQSPESPNRRVGLNLPTVLAINCDGTRSGSRSPRSLPSEQQRVGRAAARSVQLRRIVRVAGKSDVASEGPEIARIGPWPSSRAFPPACPSER